MKSARMSYEVLVERHLSPATLATFPVALTTTTVPRNRVHRLRVHADQDLADVVRRLTERRVQLLEIRRCPPPRAPGTASPPAAEGTPGTADVIDFPAPVQTPPVPDRRRPGRWAPATVSALAPAALRGRRKGSRTAHER